MNVRAAHGDGADFEQHFAVADGWNRNFAQLDGERLERVVNDGSLCSHSSLLTQEPRLIGAAAAAPDLDVRAIVPLGALDVQTRVVGDADDAIGAVAGPPEPPALIVAALPTQLLDVGAVATAAA